MTLFEPQEQYQNFVDGMDWGFCDMEVDHVGGVSNDQLLQSTLIKSSRSFVCVRNETFVIN